MVMKKETVGEVVQQPKELWDQELIAPISMRQFAKDTAQTEKMIIFGESGSGKTRFYLSIPSYLKKQGVPKENILMCIVYPDRSTGLTKIHKLIPEEFLDNVLVFPVNNYEETVSATAVAEKKLKEHYQKTGTYGWFVSELLEENWRQAQDYYSRKAFGETLADLMAAKRQEIQELMKAKDKEGKDTAYQALEGFKDWVVIKFYHNFNWIDKIKKFPFNILFTSELKDETNKDSIFYDLSHRPAGEKDNIHRVDTVIYTYQKNQNFFIKPFKLTGFSKLYGELSVTNKNSYEVHRNALKRLEELGHASSKFEELEKEAGIKPPKPKPVEKEIVKSTEVIVGKKEEPKVDGDWEV